MEPRVFTVVLNYRSADDTLACVGSLRASTVRNQRLAVVDNGSGDGSVRRLRDELGAVRLIAAPDNLGYAGGNNLAIRHALEHDADFVWVLNPDTLVEPTTLEALLAVARARPRAGLVGSRVLYGESDPPIVSCDGGVIDWERGGATSHRNDGRPANDVSEVGPIAVDYVSGTSMLVRRELLESVGLLPEEYFLYFEETDLSVRAARAGWEVLNQPTSTVRHFKRSFGRVPSGYYVYYYVRNRIHFGRRYSDATLAQLRADLTYFIDTWRERVAKNAPGWLATYDQLVSWAVEDAAAGRFGRRDEVHELAPAEAVRD